MKEFSTKAGKEIKLVVDPKTAHYKLYFGSGGELPENLTGLYTSEKAAEEDINKYLAEKNKK